MHEIPRNGACTTLCTRSPPSPRSEPTTAITFTRSSAPKARHTPFGSVVAGRADVLVRRGSTDLTRCAAICGCSRTGSARCLMTEAELLCRIQSWHIFLRREDAHLAWWSPGRKLPRSTRRALRQHESHLLARLDRFDIHVCPTPNLHRQYWSYAGQACYTCEACKRLA